MELMSPKELKRSGGWSITFGILLLIAGLLAIGAPLVTGVAVEILVGSLIIAAGIMQLIQSGKAPTGGARAIALVGGFLAIICGILMLAHPLAGLSFLTLLLAAYFFIDGLMEIAFSVQVKPAGGWGWLLAGGIVTTLFGALILARWPLSGAWAVGTLVGVSIIFLGASSINMGISARHEAHDLEVGPST